MQIGACSGAIVPSQGYVRDSQHHRIRFLLFVHTNFDSTKHRLFTCLLMGCSISVVCYNRSFVEVCFAVCVFQGVLHGVNHMLSKNAEFFTIGFAIVSAFAKLPKHTV